MRRVLIIVAIVVVALVLMVAVALTYINYTPIQSYANEAPDLEIVPTEARVAEGARIASMMCANCHRSEDRRLGGAQMLEASDFGTIWSSNITNHPTYGIKEYTDGELAYLLRTGVKKNGQYSPPYMPKFPLWSDEDMASVIAFLRSDHPQVQPSDFNPPASSPNLLAKILTRVAFGPLPYPAGPISSPSPTDEVAYGEYVAVAKFDCYQCHSADFATNSSLNPSISTGFFGGGNMIQDLEGNRIASSNLTMDPETGIAHYTKAQFSKALRTGIKPDGTMFRYPMLPYSQMTDEEAGAIWEYLKTIPIIHNEKLKEYQAGD